MIYDELDDLKFIKKHYGEKMSHFCRDLFPTILERPGFLYHILTKCFYPSKSLYYDIINENKEESFKKYIYSFVKDVKEEIDSYQSVRSLLASVGYDIYKCKNNDDIQKFKKYYAPGEELCTFRDPNRIVNHDIYFIVKKNVDKIRREDFKEPRREDEYSTSVLDLQFDKGEKQRVSIKSRYNHRVNNPDATYSNNLDRIVPGLTNAFKHEFGYKIDKSYKTNFELDHYVRARDRKFYKYNYEINNIHYCPDNIIIDNGYVFDKYKDKGRYTVLDYFILDCKEKTMLEYKRSIYDSFYEIHKYISNIKIKNIDSFREIELLLKDGSVSTIKIDKDNKIVSFKNENLEDASNRFMHMCTYLSEVYLPNLKSCGNCFIEGSKYLTSISLPKLEKCGVNFLLYNNNLEEVNLPKLKECGDSFMSNAYSLEKIDLPELVSCGHHFMARCGNLKEISIPSLESCKNRFLVGNNSLVSFSAPKLKKCQDHFLSDNNSITKIYLPSLETCCNDFLCSNEIISELDLPSLVTCRNNFMKNNKSLKTLYLPSLEKCVHHFLHFNDSIEEIDLPSLKMCGDYFLSRNDKICKVNLPSLEDTGLYFLRDNNILSELHLENLKFIKLGFLQYNEKLTKLVVPNLKRYSQYAFRLNEEFKEKFEEEVHKRGLEQTLKIK